MLSKEKEEEIYYETEQERIQESKDEDAIKNGYTIRCHNCRRYLTEEDLVRTTIDKEALDACPDCMTDEYLIDL